MTPLTFQNSEVDSRGKYMNNARVSHIDRTLKDVNNLLNEFNSNIQQFISDASTASQIHDEFSELEELFLNKLVNTENEIASLNNLDSMGWQELNIFN